jgi:hypothetical protein
MTATLHHLKPPKDDNYGYSKVYEIENPINFTETFKRIKKQLFKCKIKNGKVIKNGDFRKAQTLQYMEVARSLVFALNAQMKDDGFVKDRNGKRLYFDREKFDNCLMYRADNGDMSLRMDNHVIAKMIEGSIDIYEIKNELEKNKKLVAEKVEGAAEAMAEAEVEMVSMISTAKGKARRHRQKLSEFGFIKDTKHTMYYYAKTKTDYIDQKKKFSLLLNNEWLVFANPLLETFAKGEVAPSDVFNQSNQPTDSVPKTVSRSNETTLKSLIKENFNPIQTDSSTRSIFTDNQSVTIEKNQNLPLQGIEFKPNNNRKEEGVSYETSKPDDSKESSSESGTHQQPSVHKTSSAKLQEKWNRRNQKNVSKNRSNNLQQADFVKHNFCVQLVEVLRNYAYDGKSFSKEMSIILIEQMKLHFDFVREPLVEANKQSIITYKAKAQADWVNMTIDEKERAKIKFEKRFAKWKKVTLKDTHLEVFNIIREAIYWAKDYVLANKEHYPDGFRFNAIKYVDFANENRLRGAVKNALKIHLSNSKKYQKINKESVYSECVFIVEKAIRKITKIYATESAEKAAIKFHEISITITALFKTDRVKQNVERQELIALWNKYKKSVTVV